MGGTSKVWRVFAGSRQPNLRSGHIDDGSVDFPTLSQLIRSCRRFRITQGRSFQERFRPLVDRETPEYLIRVRPWGQNVVVEEFLAGNDRRCGGPGAGLLLRFGSKAHARPLLARCAHGRGIAPTSYLLSSSFSRPS